MPDCDPILHLVRQSEGVEVGCARGVSSEAFLLRQCEMLFVDPWNKCDGYEEELGLHGAYEEFCERVGKFWGWKALRTTSEVAARTYLHPRGFDFAFIDGNHKYEFVLQDCRLWWEHLRDGGWLFGHDYNLPCHEWGVKVAVDEFAKSKNLTVQEFPTTKEGGFSCWGIKKPEVLK